MLDDTVLELEQVTQSCIQCHDACIRTIAQKRGLPNVLRDTLVELLHVCADVCRTTAGAMVSPEVYSLELVRLCWQICEACGQALADVQGFSGLVHDCKGGAAACRRFSSIAR